MANSSATNELLLRELQQRNTQASESRNNIQQIKNFFLVLAAIVLTIIVATLLAAPAREAVTR
jgi:lipopolysaccharide export LptBFGC system permease protein LptF